MTKFVKTFLLATTFVATSNLAFADEKAAKETYQQVCSACHATGVIGAPKFGDIAAWAPRVANGKDGVYASAINGKGSMPARGGSSKSDDEIKAIVDYMVDNSTKL